MQIILDQFVWDCVNKDYKTDSFSSSASRTYVENVLKERHTRQLGYYRMACEKLFGILPSHTYLYAFALNDVIEI